MDYEGIHYCGFAIEWNYEKGYVDISMPKYIPALLQKLQHPKPANPQYAPSLGRPSLWPTHTNGNS